LNVGVDVIVSLFNTFLTFASSQFELNMDREGNRRETADTAQEHMTAQKIDLSAFIRWAYGVQAITDRTERVPF
jgi:hypothetical protein